MFLELFELLQFIQKVKFPLLMCFYMIHPDSVCFLRIFFLQVFPLHLIQHSQLLDNIDNTPNFSLKDLDYSSTLWFIKVITIFLLYFKWSLISLLNSAFLTWLSSLFFFYSIDISRSYLAFCLTFYKEVNFLLTFNTFLTVFSSLCFI